MIDLRAIVAIETPRDATTTHFLLSSGHTVVSPHARHEDAVEEKWKVLKDLKTLAGEVDLSYASDYLASGS
ncbi:hypothetical protein RRSWK_00103 [Rhodopirellula sp. SWK7]|nr:hypothetical protein RRSWK_00103 [Rhodopirellula sp. SWK7]